MKTNYTREELINLCEKSITNYKTWRDRDMPEATKHIGTAWALLKSDCPFNILDTGDLKTDNHTIWFEIKNPSFTSLDRGESFEDGHGESDTFYLPTLKLLEAVNNQEWY